MTTDVDERADTIESEGLGPLPRWKKILLSCAAGLMAVGLVLLPFSGGSDDLSTSQHPENGATIAPTGQDPDTQTESRDPLSPAFLRLGFSFFVGFAVGYAFRAFLKLALIFLGMQLLAVFLLSYLSWVTVNWETIADSFDLFLSSIEDDAMSFRTFMTGSLPQAGLASLGLFTGFRKN